ncbi:alpha/beta fold hydrolase [Bacillus sp. V5-8f]|uniref:alpha/beta fold hydrolase n=1 Tax=Bacillus sp. V5-8f TaxID=2053044 RepID=UPI000C78A720|nr:alpha/beta fold hydrolase [Bacillus sp. V5-8f]PLT33275.1 hydroxyalkanoic acid synthase [Bacillus sp. V5-8f]
MASTETTLKNLVPVVDMEKETNRWKQVYKIVNDPKPDIEHAPRQMVWRKNKSVLWHYPAKEKKYDIPLFFVYSLLNKPYILDIGPGNSVIGGLAELGYDVYLLDWGSPAYEDKGISIETYILDYLERAVKRALRHSRAEEISLIGYCLGGTISAIFTSITNLPIKNLVLATVPIDYSVGIIPEKWLEALNNGTLSVDRLADVYGVIPPEFTYSMFRGLSPIYVSPYVNLVSRAHDDRYVDKWRRMDKWTRDTGSFAGAAFKQMFNDLYRDNKLMKGELVIGGKKVDLKNITCPLFVVSSSNDNLVMEAQSLPIMDLVGSEDKTYNLIEAGHVSLALTGKFAVVADQWLSSRSNKGLQA